MLKRLLLIVAIAMLGTNFAAARSYHHSEGSFHFSRKFACPGCNKEDHYVSGYTKRDGAYVEPHMQSNPNGTRDDNFSHVGNVNPYTGVPGDKN
jgi:hypothetical protein